MIPYARQSISSEDIDAVVEVLGSDFLTQGKQVPAFEKAVATYCDARHGVAVNSGTSALHLACMALDVGAGDRVWTSPNTFVASANCALYCGAEVDFVDIEEGTWNMSVAALEEKLAGAKKDGTLPKVVIAVHFAGHPCDMHDIALLGRQYGFRIIEDATHGIGARYRDEAVGAGRYSDLTVFSFHAVKLVTSGEGGMLLTNNDAIAGRLRRLRSHGIQSKRERDGGWHYELVELGFNYRLTELQAALGLSQVKRLDEFITCRGELADRYNEALRNLPLVLPLVKDDCTSSWHLYPVKLVPGESLRSRSEVFYAMREAGIGVNVHYIPVYQQPLYRQRYGDDIRCPVTEDYYAGALTLPLHPSLGDGGQDRVIQVLADLLG